MPPRMGSDDQGPLDFCHEVCTQTPGPADLRTDYDDLSRRDLLSCVSNEVMQEGYEKPLFARDYEEWAMWNPRGVCI